MSSEGQTPAPSVASVRLLKVNPKSNLHVEDEEDKAIRLDSN